MKTLRAMACGIVGLMVGGQASVAASGAPREGDFRTRITIGDWANSDTWEERVGESWVNTPNVPGANDVVTIQATHTVRVNGTVEAVKTLIMEEHGMNPAILVIQKASASLTIHHALHMANDLTGPTTTIKFAGQNPPLVCPQLITKADITIAGVVDATTTCGGRIVSDAPGDVVTVSATGKLTATGGDLTVVSADVVMDGTVNPGSNRTISFTGGINSGSSGKWELTAPGSKITIATTGAVNIVSSAGHILITDGTLDIDRDFTFSGGLKQTGGTIDVAPTKTFTTTGRFFD